MIWTLVLLDDLWVVVASRNVLSRVEIVKHGKYKQQKAINFRKKDGTPRCPSNKKSSALVPRESSRTEGQLSCQAARDKAAADFNGFAGFPRQTPQAGQTSVARATSEKRRFSLWSTDETVRQALRGSHLIRQRDRQCWTWF